MTGEFPAGFQWDEKKNKINIRDHHIDFRDAVRVFEHPTWDRIDDRENYGEVRTNSLGELDGLIVVNVNHTDRNGDIRLMSARSATHRERELYREFVRDLALGRGETMTRPNGSMIEGIGERASVARTTRCPVL